MRFAGLALLGPVGHEDGAIAFPAKQRLLKMPNLRLLLS